MAERIKNAKKGLGYGDGAKGQRGNQTVTVGSGDSYASIAGNNRDLMVALIQANNGQPLRPGMVIRMPGRVGKNAFFSDKQANSFGMGTAAQVKAAYAAGGTGNDLYAGGKFAGAFDMNGKPTGVQPGSQGYQNMGAAPGAVQGTVKGTAQGTAYGGAAMVNKLTGNVLPGIGGRGPTGGTVGVPSWAQPNNANGTNEAQPNAGYQAYRQKQQAEIDAARAQGLVVNTRVNMGGGGEFGKLPVPTKKPQIIPNRINAVAQGNSVPSFGMFQGLNTPPQFGQNQGPNFGGAAGMSGAQGGVQPPAPPVVGGDYADRLYAEQKRVEQGRVMAINTTVQIQSGMAPASIDTSTVRNLALLSGDSVANTEAYLKNEMGYISDPTTGMLVMPSAAAANYGAAPLDFSKATTGTGVAPNAHIVNPGTQGAGYTTPAGYFVPYNSAPPPQKRVPGTGSRNSESENSGGGGGGGGQVSGTGDGRNTGPEQWRVY